MSMTFLEVDDALYEHEQPYYAYCASGAGGNPALDDSWVCERQRLTELWTRLQPIKLRPRSRSHEAR